MLLCHHQQPGLVDGVDPPMEIHPSERLQFYDLRRTRPLSDAYSTRQPQDRARECDLPPIVVPQVMRHW